MVSPGDLSLDVSHWTVRATLVLAPRAILDHFECVEPGLSCTHSCGIAAVVWEYVLRHGLPLCARF